MISEIFLDVDGVLANFIEPALACHNIEYDEATYPKGQREIGEFLKISEDEFWRKIDLYGGVGFWMNMKPYPWKEKIIQAALRLSPKVALLSSPHTHPNCYHGRRRWVDTHIPDGIELILCKSKHYLASPSRLLVDDNDKNIEKWRAAGGVGILFPQPWNRNNSIGDRIKYLSECLEIARNADPDESGDALIVRDPDEENTERVKRAVDEVFGVEDGLEPEERLKKPSNPKDALGVKKVPESTVPAQVVLEIGLGMLEGALKYGRHNYREIGVRASVYYDALNRHVKAWWEGEDEDPDSVVGLHHITKALSSLTVLRDAMITGKLTDDRPPALPAGWMEELNAKAAALIEAHPEPVAAYTAKPREV